MPLSLSSLIGQGFQAAYYCLFDVFEGFIYIISLEVASRKRRAAHYVTALFCLLEEDFEVHDIRSLSIGKDLC